MNLLFFYRIYPAYGGVEVVTTVLANRLVKDGHHVTIASIEQPHKELLGQLDKSIQLVKLEYPVTSSTNVQLLHKIIVRDKIDLIINQWGLPFKTTMLCNRAIKGTSCQLVSVLHGSPYTSKVLLEAKAKYTKSSGFAKLVNWTKYEVIDKTIRWSIRYNVAHNKRYILLSPGFIDPLVKYAHLKSRKNITAIGNPITIDVKDELVDIEHKKKQLLYVGRMDLTNKNVNRIVETWEMLWKKYPDWELVLVGDGPDKDKLVKYVEEKQIGNVRFEGFQKDPPINYYVDASIFLLTSDLEGFGLVVIESMSYGMVPIVYGSYEAIYDIIEEGKSGFITPMPFSHQQLADKIEYLINHEDVRIRMAYQAKERARLFDLDSIIKKWYSLFDEVLNGK